MTYSDSEQPLTPPTPLDGLRDCVMRIAQTDGDHSTVIAALSLHRRSAATEPVHCLYGPALAITVSGRKRVTLGEEVFTYGPGQTLLTTVDLPVVAHITQASAAEPYLGLMLRLDPRQILQLAAEIGVPRATRAGSYRAMSLGDLDPSLLKAVERLVLLLDEPTLAPQIAPLIQQEILVRLLSGEHGPQLRHLVSTNSPSQQIAQSMAWLKQHFTRAISLDELAENAHMSPSTYRQHFRAISGMSPLQYLKQLRLQEARQLMFNQDLDAGSAGLRVGYESASQFSREYTRLFGEPPLRDIKRLRQTVA